MPFCTFLRLLCHFPTCSIVFRHCKDSSGSHGWLAILVISSLLSPRLPSPSPSLALTSHRHGLLSTPTPSQNAPQPPIDRPRIPTACVALSLSTPGLSHQDFLLTSYIRSHSLTLSRTRPCSARFLSTAFPRFAAFLSCTLCVLGLPLIPDSPLRVLVFPCYLMHPIP
ncbi:hypothetical protein EDB89DRAFT_1468166 [Lactarius sanguifluus]|nr:hypothetical protein EDB89DRAFT_1468166 [Lactarius sanguifluus]